MSSYLSKAQVDQILRPINPKRVAKDKRTGNAYVQAYDVRAHMARVFGVARWSSDLTDLALLFDNETKTKKGDDAWYVGYRATVRVTVFAPDGTQLATYTEAHAGASTHPERGEAHGLAITFAESYAFKRAAVMALLDQGGLSLYGGGSTDALVVGSRNYPFVKDNAAAPADVDAHITEALADEVDPEVRPVEPAPEVREKSTRDPQPVKATVSELQARMDRMAQQGRKP